MKSRPRSPWTPASSLISVWVLCFSSKAYQPHLPGWYTHRNVRRDIAVGTVVTGKLGPTSRAPTLTPALVYHRVLVTLPMLTLSMLQFPHKMGEREQDYSQRSRRIKCLNTTYCFLRRGCSFHIYHRSNLGSTMIQVLKQSSKQPQAGSKQLLCSPLVHLFSFLTTMSPWE